MNIFSVSNPRLMKRCSFALIEVCVGMILIGVVTGYLFLSGFETLNLYRQFQMQISCERVADEQFSQLLASYLITPPEFEALDTEEVQIFQVEEFRVESSSSAEFAPEGAKQPAAKLTLKLRAIYTQKKSITAERSTTLCVVKGDLSVKEDPE